MALQETSVYRALHRHELFLGCERGPGILFVGWAGIAAGFSFMGRNWLLAAALVAALVAGVNGLRALAKVDPQWLATYRARKGFRGFYFANSAPYRKDSRCAN